MNRDELRESGVRSQESGVRSQESGVRSQEPGARLPEIVAPVARRVRQMVKERSQGGDGGYWVETGLRFVRGRARLRLLEKRRRAALESPQRSITIGAGV